MSVKKYYRVFSKRTYVDSDGEEQTKFYLIGHIKLMNEEKGYFRDYRNPNEDNFVALMDANEQDELAIIE